MPLSDYNRDRSKEELIEIRNELQKELDRIKPDYHYDLVKTILACIISIIIGRLIGAINGAIIQTTIAFSAAAAAIFTIFIAHSSEDREKISTYKGAIKDYNELIVEKEEQKQITLSKETTNDTSQKVNNQKVETTTYRVKPTIHRTDNKTPTDKHR